MPDARLIAHASNHCCCSRVQMGHLLFFQVHGLLARGEDKLVGLGNVNLLEVKGRCSGVCRPLGWLASRTWKPVTSAVMLQVLERGTKQVVEVPLMRDGCEAGAVELCIVHRAMPDH